MRFARSSIPLLILIYSSAIGIRPVAAQLRIGVITPAHWVREELRQRGLPELFSGPWDSLVTTWEVSPSRDSLSALRVALVETGVTSIVPGGKQTESCRDYGLLVQGISPADRRAVFLIGDMRQPKVLRIERLHGGNRLRLTLEGSDCLTYELVAAQKPPLLRRYEIEVSTDTVIVQRLEN